MCGVELGPSCAAWKVMRVGLAEMVQGLGIDIRDSCAALFGSLDSDTRRFAEMAQRATRLMIFWPWISLRFV